VDKQYKYAEKKNIPFVATIVPQDSTVRIKDIRNGQTQIADSRETVLGMFVK
jgi:hypothetical protein